MLLRVSERAMVCVFVGTAGVGEVCDVGCKPSAFVSDAAGMCVSRDKTTS